MSTPYSHAQEPRVRSAFMDAAGAAGPVPIALVVLGGLSLGLLLWYGTIVRLHALSALGDGLLVAALPAGVVLALLGWVVYAGSFARRAGIDLATALRADAWSWATLVAFPIGILAPLHASSAGRSVVIGAVLWVAVKVFVAARYERAVRDTLIVFVVSRVPIIFIAELASIIIGQRPGQHIVESANPILAVWGRWDAVHYLDIARTGYYGTNMAFFPLYPGLVNVVGRLVGNAMVAGLLISNVSFFFGLLFFYKLVEHELDRSNAFRAIFYISIFPTAVFFSAVYTESLFFALTVASFYYIRERRWVTAGLLGGLAALTRVEGVLLLVPFAMEAVAALRAGRLAGTVRALAGAALIPLGLVIYMGLLWVLRGDPLYFSHVQIHWNRHLAPPWVAVWRSFHILATAHGAQARVGQVIELAFTVLMIAVLIGGFKRLRPSFWVYMALSILIPMCTSSLMSMPRFALVLFPMFMVLAQWGARNWINSAIVSFSLPLLGLFTVLFADWYWVA